MLPISTWAKRHVAYARITITVFKILLAVLALYVSRTLTSMEWSLPAVIPFIAMTLFSVAVIVYPGRTKKKFSRSFAYRKSCDFVLTATSFIMLICFFQQQESKRIFPSLSNAYAATGPHIKKKTVPTAEEILKSLEQGRDRKALTRTEKRVLKKEFKKQLGVWIAAKISGNKEGEGKAGLIILAIIVAVGLLYLVAALSCSLSCNGADGAAIAVGLLGAAAVVLGLIAVIRRIKRGPKKKAEPEQ